MDPSAEDRDALIGAMLDDLDRGALASLEHYQERFPGLADFARTEWAGLRELSEAEARGELVGPPSGEMEGRIGRYELRSVLGGGGMGLAWLAHDPETGRDVVLKRMRSRLGGLTEAQLRRFDREARLLARIAHPAICTVLDVVVEGSERAVVLPYLEGETLQGRLLRARELREKAQAGSGMHDSRSAGAGMRATGAAGKELRERGSGFWLAVADPVGAPRVPSRAASDGLGFGVAGESSHRGRDVQQILRFFELLCEGVAAAHRLGIVHRDLKPANVFVRFDGSPVVLDFGLAFEIESEEEARLTQEGELLGSLPYMAPEQVDGALSRIGPATDVWALGVMLYEALTLERPFEAESSAARVARISRGDFVRPRQLNPQISRDLELVVLHALGHAPEDRYADAAQLAEDLACVRTLRPIQIEAPSIWRRTRELARRQVLRRAVFFAMLGLSLLFGISQWQAAAHNRAIMREIAEDPEATEAIRKKAETRRGRDRDFVVIEPRGRILRKPSRVVVESRGVWDLPGVKLHLEWEVLGRSGEVLTARRFVSPAETAPAWLTEDGRARFEIELPRASIRDETLARLRLRYWLDGEAENSETSRFELDYELREPDMGWRARWAHMPLEQRALAAARRAIADRDLGRARSILQAMGPPSGAELRKERQRLLTVCVEQLGIETGR